jgi:hypothetical protein
MRPHRPGSQRSQSSGPDLSRSPTDLQVNPETLSTTLATLENPGRPYPDPRGPALAAQGSPLGRGTAPPVGPQIAGFAL